MMDEMYGAPDATLHTRSDEERFPVRSGRMAMNGLLRYPRLRKITPSCNTGVGIGKRFGSSNCHSRAPVEKSWPATPRLEFTTICLFPPASTMSGVLYEVTPAGASAFQSTAPVFAF